MDALYQGQERSFAGCGTREGSWPLKAKTAYGGGTSEDIADIQGSDYLVQRHQAPQPNTASAFVPAYQHPGGAQYDPLTPGAIQYANQFQTYNFDEMLKEINRKRALDIQSIDITTLGFSPM